MPADELGKVGPIKEPISEAELLDQEIGQFWRSYLHKLIRSAIKGNASIDSRLIGIDQTDLFFYAQQKS